MSITTDPSVTSYLRAINLNMSPSPDEISAAMSRHLKERWNNLPGDEVVLDALRETMRRHPNCEGVVRDFLRSHLNESQINDALKQPKSTGPVPVDDADIDSSRVEFDRLYRERTQQALEQAKLLGQKVLSRSDQAGFQRDYFEDHLRKIEDIIQRGDFHRVGDRPLEVMKIYRLHETPERSNMFNLARAKVQEAVDKMAEFIKLEPGKYEHLKSWPEAEDKIAYYGIMIEAEGYRIQAEDFINGGKFDEAKSYFEMYLDRFPNDPNIKDKIEILEKLLPIYNIVKGIADNPSQADDIPATQLNNWIKILGQAVSVCGGNPQFNEIKLKFQSSIRGTAGSQVKLILDDLTNLKELTTMEETRRQLASISTALATLETLVPPTDDDIRTARSRISAKQTLFREYEELVSKTLNSSDEELIQALDRLAVIQKEFGVKVDIATERWAIIKILIDKANSKANMLSIIGGSQGAQRAQTYVDKVRKLFPEQELMQLESYLQYKTSRSRGVWMRFLILFALIFVVIIWAILRGRSTVQMIAEAVFIPTATPVTPTATPLVITSTPLPTSTSTSVPTLTPSATPMPHGIVSAPNAPYFFFVLDQPNGKQQSALVKDTDSVLISDCIVDSNNITWYEIRWGSDNSLSGWLNQYQLRGISGNLYCH